MNSSKGSSSASSDEDCCFVSSGGSSLKKLGEGRRLVRGADSESDSGSEAES